ncbi:hypothetical protein KSP40_PGU021925 [Platanthera guangdongensis]|uniref:Uncharacterized protein n=1 Tax=Platanthera guangdongensis TaxID=2320717 RepID=A0ABR2MKH6_9ASPA
MYSAGEYWQSDSAGGAGTRGKKIVKDTMDFLSRSWSASALEVVKALSSPTSAGRQGIAAAILEDVAGCVEEEENADVITGNSFTFASPATSQLVLEKILTQSQEASQLTTGRLSHSNGGPLNGGSLSPPVSPSDRDDSKYGGPSIPAKPVYREEAEPWEDGLKTEGTKERVTRAQTAHLHAAVSVAGLSALQWPPFPSLPLQLQVRMTPQPASSLPLPLRPPSLPRSALRLQSLSAARAWSHSCRSSLRRLSINSRAERAATLKARVLKEMWNTAAVIPNFLSRGSELLKRTRKGKVNHFRSLQPCPSFTNAERSCSDLHWKMVSVYIHRTAQVKLKMKSRHVAGTITKKKKHVVIEVCRDIPSWPGRHLLSGGEERRYFGLKTAEKRVIEFECKGRRAYEMWTTGVSRLLAMAHSSTLRPCRISPSSHPQISIILGGPRQDILAARCRDLRQKKKFTSFPLHCEHLLLLLSSVLLMMS